ncbi:MAG: hypothetical protein CMO01_17380 [Thalassobius sp.]|nr:hypothetical protein [Thalassovita sp.]
MNKLIYPILLIAAFACSEIKKSPDNFADLEKLNAQSDSIPEEAYISQDSLWAIDFLADSVTDVDIDDYIFDNEGFTGCVDWHYPDELNFSKVLDAMKWQHPSDIHYRFDYYPCDIKGELDMKSGKSYDFSMNSGGFIAIYNDEENFYLGSEKEWLKRYFLGIKLTDEEMEN